MKNCFQIACSNLALDCATMVTGLNIPMSFNTKIFSVALMSLNAPNANTIGALQKSLPRKQIGELLKPVKIFEGEYDFNRRS